MTKQQINTINNPEMNYEKFKTHTDEIKSILTDISSVDKKDTDSPKNKNILEKLSPAFIDQTKKNADVLGNILASTKDAAWETMYNMHQAMLQIAFDLITHEVIEGDLVERFIAQMTNTRNIAVFVERIQNPNKYLQPADQFTNNESKGAREQYIKEYLSTEIRENFSQVKAMPAFTDQKDIELAKKHIDELISDPDLKLQLHLLIDEKFIEWIAPQLSIYVEETQSKMRKVIQDKDIFYATQTHRKEYNKICDEIARNIPVWIKDVSKEKEIFTEIMDHLTKDLIEAVINWPFSKTLDECESLWAITILKTKDIYKQIIKQIWTIEDETIQNNAQLFLDEAIKSAIFDLNSVMPKIKTHGDMVNFDGVEFPVFKDKTPQKKKSSRKLDPKIEGENVILNFKERHTGKIISPTDEKRLRLDNPLEISREDYKTLQKNIKEVEEKIKKGENVEIPYVMWILTTLNKLWLPILGQNLGKVPTMSDKIKITPDTIQTIKKLLKSCEAQLIRGEGITILEGEAGVGKNVNIDIIGHYTNRPVFTFACSPKTDREDITYLRTLDEKGTKKLNSLVYEAIRTPGAILVLDEINTLDDGVAKQLNALFDYRRSLKMAHVNGPEQAEEGVILLGTMNPTTYAGTKPLPQDVTSRAEIISQEYEPLFEEKEHVLTTNYSEMIKMVANIPYFWKLLPLLHPSEIKEWEKIMLKKSHGHLLSEKEEKQLTLIQENKLPEHKVLEIRNALHTNNEEILQKYPPAVREGMHDIYEILCYANFVRVAYKANKEWWEDQEESYAETTFNISVSPRLLYQMVHRIHDGMPAKEAFLDIYLGQIPNIQERAQIKKFFENKNSKDIEEELKKIANKEHLNDSNNDE
jgi:MoxR-like ATPase